MSPSTIQINKSVVRPTVFDGQKQVLSSLDTSYRTNQNKISFTPVDSIDRGVVKANINAMNYYVSEKTQEIKKSLLSKIYNDWILRDYPNIDSTETNFVSDIKNEQFPIEVIIKYNKGLINYKNACLLDFAEKQFTRYIENINKTSKYLVLEHETTGEKALKKL